MRNQSSQSIYFCISTVLLFLHKSLHTYRLIMPLLSSLWESTYKFELQSITELFQRTAALHLLSSLWESIYKFELQSITELFQRTAASWILTRTTLFMHCLSIYILHQYNQFSSSFYTAILSSSYFYTSIHLQIVCHPYIYIFHKRK